MADEGASKPIKAWAVTAGEYSDYSVCAVFERQGDADQAMLAGLGDDTREIMYYPAGAELPRRVGYWRAWGTIWPDDRVEGPTANPEEMWTSFVAEPVPTKRAVLRENEYLGRVSIVAECLTEAGALKAVADRIAQRRSERLESTDA